MTLIDIYNMALSSLGHERQVSAADEQTKEARLCSTWYDTARQSVLGAAWWTGLARFTGPDDGVADGGVAGGGTLFRYWMPGCGRWLRTEAYDEAGRETDIVETDGASLLLRVPRAAFKVAPDEEDPEAWPHDVRPAVAAALAALIAHPLTGKQSTVETAEARARTALSKARANHANLTRRHGETNRYAAARREGWT